MGKSKQRKMQNNSVPNLSNTQMDLDWDMLLKEGGQIKHPSITKDCQLLAALLLRIERRLAALEKK